METDVLGHLQVQVGTLQTKPPVPTPPLPSPPRILEFTDLADHWPSLFPHEQRKYQERAGPLSGTVWSDSPTSYDSHNTWLHDDTFCNQCRRTLSLWQILSIAHCQLQTRNGPNAGLVFGRLLNERGNHVTACRAKAENHSTTAAVLPKRDTGAHLDEETTIPALARLVAILDIAVHPVWAAHSLRARHHHHGGQSPPHDPFLLNSAFKRYGPQVCTIALTTGGRMQPAQPSHISSHRRHNPATRHAPTRPTLLVRQWRRACTSRYGPQTARNRILQFGGTVATHTVGGKHDLAAEAANNMKPLTVELHFVPVAARPPTGEGTVHLAGCSASACASARLVFAACGKPWDTRFSMHAIYTKTHAHRHAGVILPQCTAHDSFTRVTMCAWCAAVSSRKSHLLPDHHFGSSRVHLIPSSFPSVYLMTFRNYLFALPVAQPTVPLEEAQPLWDPFRMKWISMRSRPRSSGRADTVTAGDTFQVVTTSSAGAEDCVTAAMGASVVVHEIVNGYPADAAGAASSG